MNRILVDTHIFVWLLSGSEELTANARHEIESCTKNEGQVLISAISIWEIGMLSQKGRITLKKPTLQWVKEALKAPYIYLAPL